MPELIDRLEAIQRIKNDFCSECDCEYGDASCKVCEYDFCIGILNEMPTIETEQRHGRWILCEDQYNVDNDNGNYAYYCSCCKHQDVHAESAKVSFCWNCGARMDLRTPTEVALDIADSVMMEGADNG